MAESVKQDDVDALVAQMQQENASLEGAAQAVKAAATSAEQIAADAQSAAPPPAPAPAPAEAQTATATPPTPQAPLSDLSPDASTSMEGPPAEDIPLPSLNPLMDFAPEIRNILSIEVPVIVQLGRRRMAVGEVMRLAVGAIIEFQKSAEEELELLANNRHIGSGHAVKVGENFGIKITKIGSVKEVIRKLGGA